ncbi:Fusaric acid resistance protein-like-domain-containing protein [Phascolomyces articulosus]|uniref:Fusaric acid resistance protein-like-domain-containing protein n=1 Tax=Phascolomyces articulosus TaxID=60185 RepID=A0AAD5KBB4_9FUNG|nr:Fusaric acid resistance protein-like-domain-containing protein [Phascolomyces articulosus]
MGAQLDATIMAVSGIVLAVAYSIAGLASSVNYNVHHSNPGYVGSVANAIFLLCGVFGAQLLRQVFPKFFFFSLHFMVLQVFTLTIGTNAMEVPYKLPVEMGGCLLIGCGVSLLVNLLIWPETAVDGLGRALRDTMTTSKDMLDMITKQFFLEPGVEMIPSKTIDETAEKMRTGIMKVRTAYKEAKYEISYTRIRPMELIDIRKSLERITKHLSALSRSLQSERELFDSILTSLQNEEEDDEDSTSPTSSDNNEEESGDHHRHQHKRRSTIAPSENTTMWSKPSIQSHNDVPSAAGLFRSSASVAVTNLRMTAMSAKKCKSSPTTPDVSDNEANSEDDDDTERNQLSVNSLKAFLHIPKILSPARPKQPSVKTPSKRRKSIHSRHDRTLLFTYLESLREPLTRLSVKCVDALVCVRDGISQELTHSDRADTEDVDDISVIQSCTSLFFGRTFRRKKRNKSTSGDGEEKRNSDSGSETMATASSNNQQKQKRRRHPHDPEHCTCADDMIQSLRQFDADEKGRIRALYEHNRYQSKHHGNKRDRPIDLTIREELFMVFFFIFTIREICKELEIMTRKMSALKERYKKKTRKRLYIPRPTLRWLRKWVKWNNHQSTRDKGGYSHGALAQYTGEKEPTNNEDEYRLAKIQQEEPLKRIKSRKSIITATSSDQHLQQIKSRTSTKMSAASSSNNSLELPSMTSSNDTYRRATKKQQRRHSVLLMDLENQLTVPPQWDGSYDETREGKDNKDDNDSIPSQQPSKDSNIVVQKPPLDIRIRYKIWRFLHYLTNYEVKFAVKTAVAVTSLCVPAFVPESAEWFIQDKGQWAAITVVAIMNPTSGGTLQAGAWRIVGTVIGAMVGWAALASNNSSPYVLALFAVLLAIPFFYIHIASTYNKFGIVVLITYVAVALTRYAQPVPGESIATGVWKRMVTVIVGIIVAMLLNSAVWPFIARHATRRSVSSISNHLGEYYSFLVGAFLYNDLSTAPPEVDIKRCTKMEKKIQASINATSVLLELTDHEPRLKGPFPKEIYREMVNSSQAILDNLGSIRVALLQMPWIVKLDVCNQQHYMYRRDMVAALMLHFYTISCSLASKIPLPVYLPSMRAARARILDHRRNTHDGGDRWIKFRNLSWYCMAFSSAEIVDELEHFTKLVRFIVGEARYSERAKSLDQKLIPDEQY